MAFSDKLKFFREAAKLSQKQLANKIEVDPSIISRYEKESGTQPRADMLLKLAYALGCTVDDLVGYKKDEIDFRLQGLQMLYGFTNKEIRNASGQTFYVISYEGLPSLTLAAEKLDQLLDDCRKETDQAFSDLKKLESNYYYDRLRLKIFEAAAAQNKK